ncbi:MAG: hypothetical protein R3Y53_06110 [Bacillota bacterium]
MGEIMDALYRGAFKPSEQVGLKKKIELQKNCLEEMLNDEQKKLLDDLLEDVSMLKNLYLEESFHSGYMLALGTLSELNYEIRNEWDDVNQVNYEFDLKNIGKENSKK